MGFFLLLFLLLFYFVLFCFVVVFNINLSYPVYGCKETLLTSALLENSDIMGDGDCVGLIEPIYTFH